MSKKTYELADKSIGFFDRETGAKLVGDGKLEIDPKARVGRVTQAAIKAGGLIEVNTKSKAGEDKSDSKAADAKAKDKAK